MLGKVKNMKLRYKIGVGVATGAAIVAGGGAAFAYWTSTGSGTGTATTGSISDDLAFSNTTISGLAPGVAATSFTVTVANNGSQSAYVDGVSAYLTVTEGSPGSTYTGYTCSSADYLLDGTAGTSSSSPVSLAWTATEIAAGSNATSGGTDTVQFNDLSTTNQDACQGATVTIHYSSN